jgi:flagellar basal-body rod modification protein FlgD
MQTNLSTSGGAAAAAAADPGAALTGAAATSDMFTKLLVAQIRNQDPLSPTDPSQFVNQLTQLSQTESLQNLASQSATNATLLQSLQALALGAQVGSGVSVAADHVSLDGSAIDGHFTLASSAQQVALVLTDVSGQDHRIELGPHAAGDVDFSLDPAQAGLGDGNYAIRIDTGSTDAPEITLDGTLQGVRVSAGGGVVLDVAHVGQTDLSAVTGFNGRTAASPN